MMKMTYIVTAKMSGGFWTGNSWSDEYPDDGVFASKKAAMEAARKAAKSATSVEVVAEHGTTDERIVAEVVR